MTAMKRCRECWVDWQRFQDNESDMFKNNDTRQTHGAAQDTVVGSLSCWRVACLWLCVLSLLSGCAYRGGLQNRVLF